ncbi:MAG: IclR family transcriptional regulator [Clostridia bacterium]|nr:IclR family transcriptional regulator [Clostridia bacterium]MDH7573050.1 IclR family transcriptional regulator [Clostridia bacterium]
MERAAEVLLCLGQQESTLSELSRQTGLSKATLFRLLLSLERKGFVERFGEAGRYGLGPALRALVSGALGQGQSLAQAAAPAMRRLGELTGETITLYVRQGTSRTCIAELVSPEPLRYSVGVGVSVPLHAGSPGKLLLAYLPSDERRRILDSLGLAPLTNRTITNRAALEQELDTIRSRGWAVSFGERIEGVSSLSVPVRDLGGRVVAALSILGPYTRLGRDKLLSYLAALQQEAEGIHAHLGVLSPSYLTGEERGGRTLGEG